MHTTNNNLLGIILMILGMFCLSVNDVNVKGLNNYFPVWEVIFFRAISGLIISFILVGYFGVNKIKTKKPVRHFIRAFSAVGCVVFYFFGLKYLFLSENVAIVHSAPILAAVLAVPILGEKLGIKGSTAIFLGFIGVIIIVKPGSNLFQLVSLLPFISAIFMASVYLSTRSLMNTESSSLMNTESSVAIIFYYSLSLFVTSLFFFPKDFVLPSLVQLIFLMSLGIVGSLGHFFLSQAAKFADVVVIAPFEYSSFVFVGIMGYYFYDEVPGISIILGVLLIIISGVYIAYREHLLNKNKS